MSIKAVGTQLYLHGKPYAPFGFNNYYLAQGLTTAQLNAFFASLPPYCLVRFWASQRWASAGSAYSGSVSTGYDWNNMDAVFNAAAANNQLLMPSLSQYNQPGEDVGQTLGSVHWSAGTSYTTGTWVYWNPGDYYGAADNYYCTSSPPSPGVLPSDDPAHWSRYGETWKWYQPPGGVLYGTTGYNQPLPGQFAKYSYKQYVTDFVNRYKNHPALGMYETMSEAGLDCTTYIPTGGSAIGQVLTSSDLGGPQNVTVASAQFVPQGQGGGYGGIWNLGSGVTVRNFTYTGATDTQILGVQLDYGGLTGTLIAGSYFAMYGLNGRHPVQIFLSNMANYIRNLDPNHLVHNGLLVQGSATTNGFFDNDFWTDTSDVWGHHDYSNPPGNYQADLSQSLAVGKPFLIGEAGFPNAIPWVSGGTYYAGSNELVYVGSTVYSCISAVSGSTTPPASDPTHWAVAPSYNGEQISLGSAARAAVAQTRYQQSVAAGGSGLLIWNASLGGSASSDVGFDVAVGDPVYADLVGGTMSHITTNGTQLALNGKKYQPLGFNVYDMMSGDWSQGGHLWQTSELNAYFQQLPPFSLTRVGLNQYHAVFNPYITNATLVGSAMTLYFNEDPTPYVTVGESVQITATTSGAGGWSGISGLYSIVSMSSSAMSVTINYTGTTPTGSYIYGSARMYTGQFNWSKIDQVMQLAASYDQFLILSLESQWGGLHSASNGLYKGLSWYQNDWKTVQAGSNVYQSYTGSIPYADLVSYRSWVQAVVARYANSPAVGMWEPMNESQITTATNDPNAPYLNNEALSNSALTAWYTAVGAIIHGLDTLHPVEAGMGGIAYGGGTGAGDGSDLGADYQTVGASPGIDVLSYHDYSGLNPFPGSTANTHPLNNLYLCLQAAKTLNKPLIVGECGINLTSDNNGSAALSPLHRSQVFVEKFAAMTAEGACGLLIWDYDLGDPDLTFDGTIAPGDPSQFITVGATKGSATVQASGTQLLLNGVPHKFYGFNNYFLGQIPPTGSAIPTDADVDAYFASLPPYSLTRFWCSQNIITSVPTGSNWGQVGTINWAALDYVMQSAVNHNQLLVCSLCQYDGTGEDTGTADYPGAPAWAANKAYPVGSWVIDESYVVFSGGNYYTYYYYNVNPIATNQTSTSPHNDTTNWVFTGQSVSGNGPEWISGAPYAAGTWITYTGWSQANQNGQYYALNSIASSTLDPPFDAANWSFYQQGYRWFNPPGGTSGTTGYNAVIPGQVAPLSFKAFVQAVVARYSPGGAMAQLAPAIGWWETISEPAPACTFVVDTSSIGTTFNYPNGGGVLHVKTTQFLDPTSGNDYANFLYDGVNNIGFTFQGVTANTIYGITTYGGTGGTVTSAGYGGCEGESVIALNAFNDQIYNLIKSIDPNHLIGSGMISGGQWAAQNQEDITISHGPLDILDYHDYTGNTALPPFLGTGEQYNILGISQATNRPVIGGESGVLNYPAQASLPAWTPNTAYTVNTSVLYGSTYYHAASSFTSGTTFASDLANNYWVSDGVISQIARAQGMAAKFMAQTAVGSSGVLIWDALGGATGYDNTSYNLNPGDPIFPNNRVISTIVSSGNSHYRLA